MFFFAKIAIFAAVKTHKTYSILANQDTQAPVARKGGLGYLFKGCGLNLVFIVALAVAAVLALSAWLGIYTRHSERIDVPSLVGVPEDEAKNYLNRAGLRVVVIDSVYADARPGSVIEQMPAAGIPVKKGRIVYLTINAHGVRMVKMQDVCEGGSRQALSTLRSLGFVVDSVRQVPSDMDDLVQGVTLRGETMKPGAEYPVGSHVVLLVGRRNVEIEPENGESEEAWVE